MLKHIPNMLTLSRILAIPLIILSFYFEDKKLAHIFGGLCFLFASITDFFDGFIARKYKIQSKFGVIFDPIADKILIGCVMLMLIKFDKVSIIPCLLIIAREFAICGLRESLAKEKIAIPVSFLAKIKTVMQMTAFFLLILGSKGSGVEFVDSLGNILLWITALMTVYTGVQYIRGCSAYIK